MPKTNSTLPTQDELKVQGLNLAKLDAKETKSLKAKTTKVVFSEDSFEMQLGKLIVNILKIENVKLISKELAKKYGIHTISKQRKSDSKILFEKRVEISTWLKSTRTRFTNLSSLLKSFAKANKPKTSDETKSQDEPKAQENETESQDSPKSDTNEPKVQKKLTVSEITLEVLVQLEIHGISARDFAREFNSQYKELKQVPSKKVA